MQFNITFFLQIFNFAITYWFLNKFMFKPVLVFIKKRQQIENKVLKGIERKELQLINLEKNKHKDLYNFKQKMKLKYNIEIVSEPQVPSEILSYVDKEEAKKIISLAKNILVERVPRVD